MWLFESGEGRNVIWVWKMQSCVWRKIPLWRLSFLNMMICPIWCLVGQRDFWTRVELWEDALGIRMTTWQFWIIRVCSAAVLNYKVIIFTLFAFDLSKHVVTTRFCIISLNVYTQVLLCRAGGSNTLTLCH